MYIDFLRYDYDFLKTERRDYGISIFLIFNIEMPFFSF